MERKTVHRGIVALAIVTSLSAAGSRPAAAMDLGFLDRLNQLWSFATGDAHQVASQAHRAAGKAPKVPGAKLGWGIDPNGNHLVDPDPTTPGLVPGNG
ncbi:MAG: hypothetical protein ABIS20_06340 [Thermoanaerobaculia bacterium]